jgi:small-conductance mechanosensitive channel
VIANSRNLYRRREFTIGISYAADARHAIELAMRTIRGVEGVLSEPPPQAVVVGLSATSVDLRILFYTSTLSTDALAVLSECILRVKEKFDAEHISIPFTSQTVNVHHSGALPAPPPESSNGQVAEEEKRISGS